jgi:hypothetical protein
MPAVETFYRWMRTHPEFKEQYAGAKEDQADALAEEIIDISDDGTNDWMERENKDGQLIGWEANGEHIQRSRLRVDSRKWLASKMKPRMFGDAATVKSQQLNGKGEPIDPTPGPNIYLAAALEAVKKSEGNGG